jgi:DNA segregation ATPase FtsK/SpoIIIE, S-DNA-T family
MARTLTSAPEGAVLPAALSAFLKRRMAELGGLALGIVAIAITVALLSYSPTDPSLNNATDQTVTNLLGAYGAVAADIGLQSMGICALIPAVIMLAWSWQLIRKRRIEHLATRVILTIIAIMAGAVAVASLSVPGNWPLVTGLGGFTGEALFDQATPFAMMMHPVYGPALMAAFAGGISAALLIYVLGWTLRDWQSLIHAFRAAGAGVYSGLQLGGRAADHIQDLRERYLSGGGMQPDDEDDVPEPKARRGVRKSADVTDPLVTAKKKQLKAGRKADKERQKKLDFGDDGVYTHPPLDLLEQSDATKPQTRIDKDLLEQNAAFLASVLEDFGIRGEIVKVRPGPVVTLYELEPAPGTKTSRVIGLSDDIARSMSAISVRVAVVPGRSVIGIELPNSTREMVGLRELLASEAFEKTGGDLPLALGKDIGGTPVCVDLARMPHLLMAGTTGSGKSVGMNAMILSLLYRLKPNECKFIMIDPKMLELSVYDGIPHLLTPVVTDPSKAVVALKWTVREMEDRYRAMSQLGVRNLAGFNSRLIEAQKNGDSLTHRVQTGFDDDGKPVYEEQPIADEPLPHIVVVVDEMADLMMVAGKDVEAAIQRLAQMARAAGIHIIMATQRPSVDVITGTIKANFPTRISFQVTSKIDSRTILGEQGAENLLGMGDMLYMAGGGRISRVHGPFVSDEEVEHVVKFLKGQGAAEFIDEITVDDEAPLIDSGSGRQAAADALYDEAVALVAREGKASTSFIQRHLQIGYNRAARIIEHMETEGVVSEANRVGRREVLIGNH